MAEKRTVTIEVYSDFVCPWCFVGKRNLEAALEKYKDKYDFQLKWKPYFLHGNTMSDEGMKLEEYLYKVYGMKMDLEDPSSALNKAGEKANIKFNNKRRMINTMRPHRLIEFSKQYNLTNQLMNVILHEYFENAVNISKIDDLVSISSDTFATSGVTSDQIRSFLEGSQFVDHINAQISQARGSVRGVPLFVINNSNHTTKVSGAQSTESFCDLFDSWEQ